MIKTIRTHYEEMHGDLGLEKTINEIGYENILNILSCYCGGGQYFYTMIYKENKEGSMANKLNQYCKNCKDKRNCNVCDIKETKDYIKKLKQELQAKDKALDKACHYIQEIGMRSEFQGVAQCERCEYLNNPGVCWDCKGNLKKMFEGVGEE